MCCRNSLEAQHKGILLVAASIKSCLPCTSCFSASSKFKGRNFKKYVWNVGLIKLHFTIRSKILHQSSRIIRVV